LNEKFKTDGLSTKSDTVGVLGLKWDTTSDQLSIAQKDLPTQEKLTKRIVTSQTASIFDPLGLIAPVSVPAKSFINQLWKGNKGWDEKLSPQEKRPVGKSISKPQKSK
jgi:hypothetical protein